jgi:hypothetical protein
VGYSGFPAGKMCIFLCGMKNIIHPKIYISFNSPSSVALFQPLIFCFQSFKFTFTRKKKKTNILRCEVESIHPVTCDDLR